MARLHSKRMKHTRQNTLLLKLVIWGIPLLLIVFLIVSQTRLVVKDGYVFTVEDLPKTFTGYKIAHISDICNSTISLDGLVKDFKPDIIVLSGGYSDDNGNSNNTVETVNKLCKIAPVYYVYNKDDKGNELDGTKAINLVNSDVTLEYTRDETAKQFIKRVYGNEILKKAKKGDKKSKSYIKYLEEELSNTKDKTIKLIGLETYDYEKGQYDARKHVNDVLSHSSSDYTLAISGSIDIVEELSNTDVNGVFVGGTFGTNRLSSEYKKGLYGLNGTQLFVSGGVGTIKGVKRIFNYPQVQCITLSDGTIENKNPLEKFIGIFIKDVGTIFDNDGGFKDYTYTYSDGQQN